MLTRTKTLQLQLISRGFSIFKPAQGKLVQISHELHGIIKWTKPDKLRAWDPQRSFDLEPLKKIDPKWLKLEYRPFASIIDKLPEDQRRLFTVEFGSRREGIAVVLEDTVDQVRRHKYDKESSEYKIAWMTVKIRSLQEQLEVNLNHFRRNGGNRKAMKELVDKRRKHMSKLKNKDYKRFEWLLEILNVLYKPLPDNKDRVERKKSYIQLTELYCEAIKRKKLNVYKDDLERQKLPFLEEKLETLQKIKADEEAMRIPCSVDEDIQKTLKQIENVNQSHLVLEPVPENQQSIEAH